MPLNSAALPDALVGGHTAAVINSLSLNDYPSSKIRSWMIIDNGSFIDDFQSSPSEVE
jgi:hypothetical protein